MEETEYKDFALRFLDTLYQLQEDEIKKNQTNFYQNLLATDLNAQASINAALMWKAVIIHSFVPNVIGKRFMRDVFGEDVWTEYKQKFGGEIEVMRETALLLLAGKVLEEPARTRFMTFSKTVVEVFLIPFKNNGAATTVEPEWGFTRRSKTFTREVRQRDGWKCHVTGKYDRRCPTLPGDVHPCHLEVAHILPLTIADKPNVHDFVKTFTGGLVKVEHIRGGAINNIRNGLLLQMDAHRDFDNFLWGMEVTYKKEKAVYKPVPVTMKKCSLNFNQLEEVKFETVNGLDIKPAESFFRLHLAVAKVLHESGAGDVIEWFYNEDDY